MLLVVLILLFVQGMMLWVFSQQVRHRRQQRDRWPIIPPGGWPSVEVVLCLRGGDSSLQSVLQALCAQHYPARWRLQVVVDSLHDAAWPILKAWDPSGLTVKIHTLRSRPQRGSLKCAALLEACDHLDPETAIVAVIDADAVVSPSWLSDLVRACLQPGVGAVSGNRWYIPERHSFNGLTRAVWNAGVVMAMGVWAIPWGGSLALRREVVEHSLWRTLLQRGLCEDTGLLPALRALDLRYEFRPELIVVDRHDGIVLFDLARWITRQLLTVRLHHPSWLLAFVYGGVSLLLPLSALLSGSWGSLLLYELGFLAILCGVEAVVMDAPFALRLDWLLVLLPAQCINGFSTLAAQLARRVEWRGAFYAVLRRPPGVSLIRDNYIVSGRSS